MPSITSPRSRIRNDAVDAIVLVRRFFARAGNDQRRTRFIDQDRIDFVDDGEIEFALDIIFQPEFHVVAQVVEPELVVRAVGDVGVVGFAPLAIIEIVHDGADGQSERAMNPAHPLGVAPRQVIVHGDDVNAFAFERVQIAGERGDQRFSFAGFHFGDAAAMQHDAADELHIEVPHVQNAAAGFAADRERFDQKVVERRAIRHALFEIDGFGG